LNYQTGVLLFEEVKMSKAFVIGFAAGLALLGILGVGASWPKQKDIEQQRYQAEIVDATPIQLNIMTLKQRYHSKLYGGFRQNVEGKTISQLIASYRGERVVLGRYVDGRMWLPSDQLEAPEEFFGRLAQESDAIVCGKAISKISQITADDSFLFTDYDVIVLDVFKNNATAPIETGKTITFTSLGGKILVDNVILKAGGNGDPPLPINAQEILLFMKFIPETGGYKLTRNTGRFVLNGTSIHPLAGLFPLPSGVFENQAAFLKMIRAVSNK
jgi:hypothetical protein